MRALTTNDRKQPTTYQFGQQIVQYSTANAKHTRSKHIETRKQHNERDATNRCAPNSGESMYSSIGVARISLAVDRNLSFPLSTLA